MSGQNKNRQEKYKRRKTKDLNFIEGKNQN